MIRAHLATFPPRAEVLQQAIASILPQVDKLFICLNQYDHIPETLALDPRIEAIIPERDLKDAGKFIFVPDDDDVVFTIDDDILYPPDYVARTLAHFDELPEDGHVFGYLGNAWIRRHGDGPWGWKNFLFHKRCPHMIKVDVVGTGTACQYGRHLPRLEDVESAAGFVDLRHARFHTNAGRWMWSLPKEDGWMRSLMTDDLRKTSLFTTVNRAGNDLMITELRSLLSEVRPHSGQKIARLRADRLL